MAKVLIEISKAHEPLFKSQIAAYTRKDGTVVAAHSDNRTAANPVAHPAGHKVGAQVFFPHPKNPGKNGLGKYMGERNGKSVIHHDGAEHEVAHDAVKKPRGLPKQADPVADRKVQAEHREKHLSGGESKAEPKTESVAHPKGHKPGAMVMFPHPEKPGKSALGKYKGQRGGKSVIEHSTGEHVVDHDAVKSARGVPKQADPKKTAEAGQALRDYQAKQ